MVTEVVVVPEVVDGFVVLLVLGIVGLSPGMYSSISVCGGRVVGGVGCRAGLSGTIWLFGGWRPGAVG